MKISTKGRYAVRVMVDLAANNTGEYIKVKSIAERQNLSEKYLEQIISILNKAGFLRSVRGAQGGYKLSHDPSYYTVGMILRLTEGSLAPVACLETLDEKTGTVECDKCDTCDTLTVWKDLKKAIDDVVDNVTIADILERQNARLQNFYTI